MNGERANIHDIPNAVRAAAFDVLAEASAVRKDLRRTAAQMAADARVGTASLRAHARRAATIGGNTATDAMETGLRAGTQAWRDARRQAAAWGSTALDQARSRPAAVLVGVAIVGVAVGFWLRAASRRTTPVANAARPSRTAKRNGA